MDVIILGAGPTGLMLSNQLTRFGIDHMIIDAKSGPTDQSRALVVQARSLEIYEQLGISDKVIAGGQKNDGINFYKHGKIATSVTLIRSDEKSTPFPFLMMYEQSKNEQLLYQHLQDQGRTVKWNSRVTKISKSGTSYQLSITENGIESSVECKYLIGCDGGKSLVREFSGVEFSGGSYLNVFFVADTHIKGFSSDKLSIFLKKDGLNMLFAMKSTDHFRALGILPKPYYHQPDLPFQEVLDKMKSDMEMPLEFYDTNWHSTYRLHHKKVTVFGKDNLFLAGDAAHVHSPAGGQGMNTGLQDAYNLGWKLALVQQGIAGRKLLETYDEERNPVAEDLLHTTDRIFSAMSTEGSWYTFFRMYFIPVFIGFITSFRVVRRSAFKLLSQIGVNYKSSSLSKGKAGKIKGGLRLPYFHIDMDGRNRSIYQVIKEYSKTPFTILVYQLDIIPLQSLNKTLYTVIEIPYSIDNDKGLKRSGFSGAFMLLVRPDNYIGYIDGKVNIEAFNFYMETAYYLKNPSQVLITT
ncbi:FAD-dependent monooxygenase [Mucilaginibacter agri]|uniref:FAD-binding domain-containing protein n=1 Tax=Mucilaginibacter agri TaxID=2695265 RepID=A0A965ZG16_9SPHI|nr:FAD-dependent monooxygenase [Mucilaginibacter agri]NCD69122.1 hypothetical protein [Mucilaginibacter agri]